MARMVRDCNTFSGDNASFIQECSIFMLERGIDAYPAI